MKRIASTSSVLALAALLTASLGACQAGTGASTSQDYDPVDGRNVNLPDDATYGDPYLAIRNATVVDLGSVQSASVTVVNRTGTDDVLESVTIGGVPAELSAGPVEIPADGSVSLGAGGDATATVEGLDVAPGDWTDLTLGFAESGVAELRVLTVSLAQVEPMQ